MLIQVFYENGDWKITNELGNSHKVLMKGNSRIAYYEPLGDTTFTYGGTKIGKGNLLVDIAEGRIPEPRW